MPPEPDLSASQDARPAPDRWVVVAMPFEDFASVFDSPAENRAALALAAWQAWTTLGDLSQGEAEDIVRQARRSLGRE